MKRVVKKSIFIATIALFAIFTTCSKENDNKEIEIAVTGVSLNITELTIDVGEVRALIAFVEPDDATNMTVKWESSNEIVATVTSGVISAKNPGTTNIKVTTNDGNYSALCKVTVNSNFIVNYTTMTMRTDKSGEVTIFMAGTGTIFINWGDGSTPETKNLLNADDDLYDINKRDKFAYRYNYFSNDTRTITITGENITHLYCYNNDLSRLDVRENTALIDLRCYNNDLTSLDVNKNTALLELDCSNNNLTSLDLSSNIALITLSCYNNQLNNLNTSKNHNLIYLYCDFNKLISLDVSNNTMLQELWCDANKITSLDVSSNTKLSFLGCRMNDLTADGLNALFETLHSNAGNKTIYIGDNPGTVDCDDSIATDKGWVVEYSWW